jgi:hypothetical protein
LEVSLGRVSKTLSKTKYPTNKKAGVMALCSIPNIAQKNRQTKKPKESL